jgi:hypothetical protein
MRTTPLSLISAILFCAIQINCDDPKAEEAQRKKEAENATIMDEQRIRFAKDKELRLAQLRDEQNEREQKAIWSDDSLKFRVFAPDGTRQVGLVVDAIDPDGPIAKRFQIHKGDVIERIGGYGVSDYNAASPVAVYDVKKLLCSDYARQWVERVQVVRNGKPRRLPV